MQFKEIYKEQADLEGVNAYISAYYNDETGILYIEYQCGIKKFQRPTTTDHTLLKVDKHEALKVVVEKVSTWKEKFKKVKEAYRPQLTPQKIHAIYRCMNDALKEVIWPNTPFRLTERKFAIVARIGSESHGTHVPKTDPNSVDDRDIMGVVIPPISYYLGLDEWEHSTSFIGEWDVVLYRFEKFVRLLIKQNPNVLSLLYLEPEDYLYLSSIGKNIIENRNLFVSKQAYYSFAGYAHGQLKKMTSFTKQGYMGAKRAELVEKYGFDCKNGSHLIRLLKMCVEYLQTGKLQVRRTTDAQTLIDIKTGKWSFMDVQVEADRLFKEAERAYKDSELPENVDIEEIKFMTSLWLREYFYFGA